MSLEEKTCTLQCLKALLTQWPKPPNEWKTSTLLRKGSLRRPLMTSNEQGYLPDESIPNGHSRRPHRAIKKTEERLTSTCCAEMDNAALPNGLRGWTEARW